MKNITILLFFLLSSIAIHAQDVPKWVTQKAVKTADFIAEDLSLNADEKVSVHDLFLEVMTENQKNVKGLSSEEKKAYYKTRYAVNRKRFVNLFGKEKGLAILASNKKFNMQQKK
ncbi:hypothetical protein OA501_00065 [Flavobacteriaceae bacterium]|nr:hypothetical protein [Flavobacteriaceae bacterium]